MWDNVQGVVFNDLISARFTSETGVGIADSAASITLLFKPDGS